MCASVNEAHSGPASMLALAALEFNESMGAKKCSPATMIDYECEIARFEARCAAG